MGGLISLHSELGNCQPTRRNNCFHCPSRIVRTSGVFLFLEGELLEIRLPRAKRSINFRQGAQTRLAYAELPLNRRCNPDEKCLGCYKRPWKAYTGACAMPAPAPLARNETGRERTKPLRLESDAATFTIYFNSTPLHGLSSFSLFSYGGKGNMCRTRERSPSSGSRLKNIVTYCWSLKSRDC